MNKLLILFLCLNLRAQTTVKSTGTTTVKTTGTTTVSSIGGQNPGTPALMWIKMNENGGTTAGDSSTAGTHSWTVSNAAMFVGGRAGASGLIGNVGSSFNGTWSSFTYGTSTITINFWARLPSSLSGVQVVTELSANYNTNTKCFLIYTDPSTFTLNAGIHDGANNLNYRAQSITYPLDGDWHHYSIVLDNSTATGNIKFYLNGVSQTTVTNIDTKIGGGNFSSSVAGYAFSRAGTSLFSPVQLDDFRIYDRELTNPEVLYPYTTPQ